MMNNKTIIAIIPARGGSKRIPRKNIVDIAGKPLLAYAIELAKKVSAIDKIVVSSEDDEILSVAAKYGAEIIKRPDNLSTDMARTEPVLIDVLNKIKTVDGKDFDYVLLLEPPMPLRKQKTVERALEKIINEDLDVVSTLLERRHYLWRFVDKKWVPLFPDAPRRSQDREPLYEERGVCYAIKSGILREANYIYGKKDSKIGFLIIDDIEGMDIDTPDDLKLVKHFLKIE